MKRFAAALGFVLLVAGSTLPAMAAQGGGKKAGAKAISGKVTAKGENSLDVEQKQRGGAATTIKVTTEATTNVVRVERGAVADVTEGYTVAIFGEEKDGKVTAEAIIRVSKPEGNARGDWAAAGMVARAAGRLAAAPRQAGQPQAKQAKPIIGRVASLQPLKVKTQKGPDVEVQAADTTRVFKLTPIKLADIPQGANVIVAPKDEPLNNAATAQAVLEVPAQRAGKAGGARQGGKKNR